MVIYCCLFKAPYALVHNLCAFHGYQINTLNELNCEIEIRTFRFVQTTMYYKATAYITEHRHCRKHLATVGPLQEDISWRLPLSLSHTYTTVIRTS